MNSFIPWLGGKSRLAKTIITKIPEHQCYVEAFAGAGNVFFRKEPSKAEVLNDLNSDLVNLYRVVKHHLAEFINQFRYVLVARDEFKRLMEVPPNTLTDIQRAARFYYIVKNSYGGKAHKPTYGYSTTRPPRLNLLRIEQDISDAHLRLCKANIENLPYQDCIKRYDRAETFFYIDPPYFGCEDVYGENLFTVDDFRLLADILRGIKGKCMVSLNDAPEMREVFRDFRIETVQTWYSLQKGGRKPIGELIIMNY
ncbi:MAG: DNA adenine methylase [Geovibrio sp.]|nr:DNA adenine methylase [Geovibrio sp.]